MIENLDKTSNYIKTIIIGYIGCEIIEGLPKSEGYYYCKDKLLLCWKWINRFNVNLEEFCDCLDNPTEKDLLYYTSNEKDKESQITYGIILQIVSYIAAQALMKEELSLPQYLEDVDDEYLNSIIDLAIEKHSNLEHKIEIIIEYCNNKIFKIPNSIITIKELKEINTL